MPMPAMFPGPDVDGRPTWLCSLIGVPDGYEYRKSALDPWRPHRAAAAGAAVPDRDRYVWVQVRRVPPAPGDRIGVYSVLDDGALVGAMAGDAPTLITFAELCEVLIDHEPTGTGAVPPWSGPPEEFRADVADATLALADAIWARLTDGDRG